MLKSEDFLANNTGVESDGGSDKTQMKSPSGRRLGMCSQIATTAAQQTSPIVFPEKRSKKMKKTGTGKGNPAASDKVEEVRIDIESFGGGDEKSDLLGGVVIAGKLEWDKRRKENSDINATETTINAAVDAKLTSNALTWGSNKLQLDGVISVTYNVGMRHFTLHAYPLENSSLFRCFKKPKRVRKDYRFLAPSVDSAIQWVGAFADQRCYINCLPYPMVSSKKQASSELLLTDPPPELIFRCKTPPKMLVILNPRSGRGRSIKVFHEFAEPIFKLAGFKLEVVQTNSAGHAKTLASSVDINTCPDGVICVGGDGIINEVLNGLLSRENQKEGISIPIGIIPAGSDNSLVWTVLGVRDPITAAISIVKGGLTATDVFAVEWLHSGIRHFGMTASYYGFVSDVLEQCEKYQKTFGPLRYLVAGVGKFLCLPKYNYELEFIRYQAEDSETKPPHKNDVVDVSEIHTDYMRDSIKEPLPRASSLSSIESIVSPNHTPSDFDHAPSEPSEYVRALDPRSKRLSFGRNTANSEPEVIHPPAHLSGSKNWPRTRSKSRTDKGWSGLTVTQDVRSSWANDREDISSTLSDPGPIWDAEPKWDTERNRDVENCIQLSAPSDDSEANLKMEMIRKLEDKWEFRKGKFLSIIVCNHACRNVQNSQEVAPKARHDDYNMDLVLIHGSGRLRLLRFFLLLQIGRHTTLPYVEYIKVKSVKIKPLKHTHNGCGIDGELFLLDGQVLSCLLPQQCRLIGRSRLTNNT